MAHYERDFIKKACHYDPAIEKEVLKRASSFVGRSVEEIARTSFLGGLPLKLAGKGKLGQAIELLAFGIGANSSPEPDFVDLGIELKTVPLLRAPGKVRVKERTKICMIDYASLVRELWMTSHARKKLKKILFLYYLHEKNWKKAQIVDWDLWELEKEPEDIIEMDWRRVQDLVKQGQAHEISERLGVILGACTAGSGGKKKDGTRKDLVAQPNNPGKPALRRAFALKQAFTSQRYLEKHKGVKFVSVSKVLAYEGIGDLEKKVLQKLHHFIGWSLKDFANEFKIKIPQGKAAAATIVKKALGFKNVNARLKEFDQLGIVVKVIPIRSSDGRPLEAVSFPAFKILELVDETWEDSLFGQYIERILFIPILKDNKEKLPAKWLIGKAFFWSPGQDELKVIRKEWERYRKDIAAGKLKPRIVRKKRRSYEVSVLLKESQTKIVHVRPHARNRSDRDVDSKGNSVIKQSFWLNKDFLDSLVRRNQV